jgi:small-conductance mechanosensitive channel
MSNAALVTKPILNLRRSPDQIDIITIQIAFKTAVQTLREFENQLASYIARRSAHFYRKFEVEYKEVENTNRMVVRVWVQHRNNFANMRRYRERRGRLVLRIKRICEDLNIEYVLPPQQLVSDFRGPGDVLPVLPLAPEAALASGAATMMR